jgi:hypothetical protein
MPNKTASDNWLRAKDYLLKNKQGQYWSYHPGQSPSIETSGWCAIALSDNVEIAKQTCNYLSAVQNKDGGFSTSYGAGPSDWSTTIACLCLRTLSAEKAEIGKDKTIRKSLLQAMNYLLEDRVEIYRGAAKVVWNFVKGSKAPDYPRGWPWSANTYNWVEPTSYAILALLPTTLSQKDPMRMAIKNGHQYLLKHACTDGGWNYGEIKRLTENLPAYQLNTAEALVALQGLKQRQEVQSGLAYLRKHLTDKQTPLTLAWSILALDALDEGYASQLSQLAAMQNTDGSFGRSMFTSAIATIALSLTERPSPLNFAKQPILDLS